MSSPAVALIRPRLRGVLHGASIPLALVGAWAVMVSATDEIGSKVTATVFGVFLVGLFTASSLYHLPPWSERARFVLSRIDVAMIQLFIAATFTPIGYHALTGAWRTWSLVVAWSLALSGAALCASPVRAPRWAATTGFVAIGWLSVVPLTRIMQQLPWQGSSLIILGGVFYTVGAVIYGLRKPNPFPRWFGFHEIFHLLVVAGATAHFLSIWRYVLPIG